jgi:hypothetical protein
MTEPTLDTLTRRLDRLERQNRWLRRVSLVILLGAVATLLMGQAPPHRPPRIVEAEEFVLRDARGQVRATLGTTQSPSAAFLRIHNDDGKQRARIIVSSDGTSSLEFMDSSDRVRVLLGVRDHGLPRVWLGNEGGRIIWRAP